MIVKKLLRNNKFYSSFVCVSRNGPDLEICNCVTIWYISKYYELLNLLVNFILSFFEYFLKQNTEMKSFFEIFTMPTNFNIACY